MPMELHWALVESGEVTILSLLNKLPWFSRAASWKPWSAFLKAVYGLPMDQDELAIYRRCTGRRIAPEGRCSEVWGAVGRRGRKSAIMALIGVYEGAFRDHRPYLAGGVMGRIPVIAKNMDEAQAIHSYIKAILAEPALSHLIGGDQTTERTPLSTQVEIAVRPATLTAGRSRAVVCSLNDEIAFWPTAESATPDTEILRGIRPGMANIKDPLLVAMSSPYAERGELYEHYEQHYGVEHDPVLFWMADTVSMHDTPAIRAFVTAEWERDPVSAAAEVGNENGISFRKDVEAFVTREAVEAVTVKGLVSVPPRTGPTYVAFVDVSGGAADSFGLAIAHTEFQGRPGPSGPHPKAVLDYVQEWKAPFDPEDVIKQVVPILKGKPEQGGYNVAVVKGDRYGGDWVRAMFARYGIGYLKADLTKSQYYIEFLPMINSGTTELLDVPTLKDQLLSLSRRVSSSGHVTIDHPPGHRDDVSNAVAGAVVEASAWFGKRPEHEGVKYLNPDGSIDWVAFQKAQFIEQTRKMREPEETVGSERYEYMK